MSSIRWGVLGAGRIAHTFARDIAATKCGVLQAVAARSEADARAFADTYNIGEAYGGYAALYAASEVDAIYVATPHSLHLQHAADALRAGKAVLCEKPLTTTAAECQALIDVATESSSYLMEAMWTWFLPPIRKAQEWVAAGRIGDIVQIKADFGYPMPYAPDKREYNAKLGGGCLLDMGVYPVAFAALFCGRDPEEVAVAAKQAPNGVEDDVAALFRYDACTAILGTSFRAKLPNRAYIIGTEASIAIPDFWRASSCELWELDSMRERFDDPRNTNGFDYQIDAVNDDLIAGRTESGIMPLAASLQIQRHMDLIRAKF